MTAAYSQDLHNRVIDAVEKEGLHRLAAANFLTTSRARNMRLWRSAQPMKKTGCRRETNEAAPQEPNLSDVLNDAIVMAVMRGRCQPGRVGQDSRDSLLPRGFRSAHLR